jgi:hypothetical protein
VWVTLKGDERDEKRAFNDVNFPAVRPWTFLALRPKGMPGGTARGHVREVKHEYRFAIRVLRRDADAIMPTSGGTDNGQIVDA